jgi:hypothetical protein
MVYAEARWIAANEAPVIIYYEEYIRCFTTVELLDAFRLCLVLHQSCSYISITWTIHLFCFWQSCFVVSEQLATVGMSMNFESVCRLCLTSGKPLLPLFDKHQTLPSKIKTFAPCLKVGFFCSVPSNRVCACAIVKCWNKIRWRKVCCGRSIVIWGFTAIAMKIMFFEMRCCVAWWMHTERVGRLYCSK